VPLSECKRAKLVYVVPEVPKDLGSPVDGVEVKCLLFRDLRVKENSRSAREWRVIHEYLSELGRGSEKRVRGRHPPTQS
jgi:hypothetical protein